MQKVLILFLVIFPFWAQSQTPNQFGSRANALGNTSLLHKDVWAIKNNPGSFGYFEGSEMGINYTNRFIISEMASQALVFGYQTKSGNIGGYFQQTGFELYRQIETGLTYGMKLSPNFSGGISLGYQQTRLGDIYGQKGNLFASLGMMYQLNDNLDLGFSVSNVNRARIHEYQNESLPTVFQLGMLYHFGGNTNWSLEFEKDISHPINVKSGLEIQAHEIFLVRLGVNSYPFQSSFGFGLAFKNFHLDMATLWHTQLGLSPSAGLKYKFK